MPPKDKGVGKSTKKAAEKRKSADVTGKEGDTGLGDEITLSQNEAATPRLLQQVVRKRIIIEYPGQSLEKSIAC